MKFRLFEFEDKKWFPDTVRQSMMDYLRFVLNTGNFYEPVAELIVNLLQDTGANKVVDLCSGGGGTVVQVQKNILTRYNRQVPFILTDIFPNINAYEFIRKNTGGKVNYFSSPVNASDVPGSLKGVRTIFSAFHHFDKTTAAQVIKNAVDAKEGIGIFDGGDKNLLFAMLITIVHPIAFFLFTPFFRPFRWSRLLLTYIIPVIPLCTIWDGIVSIMRLYKPAQLLSIATSVEVKHYHWEAGKKKNKFGMSITYLVGYPIATAGNN